MARPVVPGRSRVSGTITPFPGAVNAPHHREGAAPSYVRARRTPECRALGAFLARPVTLGGRDKVGRLEGIAPPRPTACLSLNGQHTKLPEL